MQPNQLAAVEKLISGLMSEDTSTRNASEKQLDDHFVNSLPQITDAFIRIALQSSSKNARSMSLILLRRKLFSNNLKAFDELNPKSKSDLKEFVLKSVQTEAEETVRRQIMALASELAEVELPRGNWPNLLPAVERFSKAANPVLRGDAFLIFGEIATCSKINDKDKETFLGILVRGMNDSDLDVRQKSLESAVNLFFKHTELDLDKTVFVTSLLKFVEDIVKTNDQTRLVDLLECLIEFVSVSPNSIRPHFDSFVKLMAGAAMATNLPEEVRILALEFLIILAESDHGVFRSSASFVQQSFMAALSLMLELEDNADWHKSMEEYEESDMYTEGEMAMDRLAQSFGSDKVLNVAMPLIIKFLEHSDWKRRVVGLISISQMAESIENAHVEKFLRTVSNYYADSNPRVVFSAIHCIGQMCEDFTPDIQNKYHSVVLPPLVKILKDSKIAKIQSHAGAALVNFTENVSAEIITPYLKDLLEILYSLMQNSHRVVKEQVVTVVACLSSITTKQFHPILIKFVQPLMLSFANCKQEEDATFRSKCLEALTFIGNELEASQFSVVAHEIMKITISEIKDFKKISEDYLDFVLQSWIRIAKTLKKDFAPYLPKVMEVFFQTANEELLEGGSSQGAVNDLDSEDDEEFNPQCGDIAEVETAICALSALPFELGFEFYPYLSESVAIIDSKADYWGEANIRVYSVRSYAALFSVVSCAVKEKHMQIEEAVICLGRFCTKLIELYNDERDFPVKKAILQSLIALLEENEDISVSYLSRDKNDGRILKAMFDLIERSQKRALKIEQKAKNSENDEKEIAHYDSIKEMETEILFKITEVFGMVLRVMKTRVVPTFNSFVEQVMLLLSNKETGLMAKKAVLLISVDAVLYIPSAMQKYAKFLLHLYITLLEEKDIDIKQAAIYGLGLVAEKYAQVFCEKSRDVLKLTYKMFALLKQKEGTLYLSLRDNVASCYGRIIFACSKEIDLAASFPVWIEMLPMEADLAEIRHSSNLLFGVLKSGDKKCIGNDLKNLPRILNIIAKNFSKVSPTDEQKSFLTGFVTQIKNLPGAVQSNLASSLSGEAKQMMVGYKSQ